MDDAISYLARKRPTANLAKRIPKALRFGSGTLLKLGMDGQSSQITSLF